MKQKINLLDEFGTRKKTRAERQQPQVAKIFKRPFVSDRLHMEDRISMLKGGLSMGSQR